MSDNEKKIKFKWLEKLKNIKHIEIYVAVIFVVVLLLIYLSNSQSSGSKTKINKQTSQGELTVTAYVSNLESDLEDVLSNINGVSAVKVMITLDMSNVSVEDSKISINTFPPVKGIIITAKGLNDTARRLKVLHAVEAVVDVTNGNIEILSSE